MPESLRRFDRLIAVQDTYNAAFLDGADEVADRPDAALIVPISATEGATDPRPAPDAPVPTPEDEIEIDINLPWAPAVGTSC